MARAAAFAVYMAAPGYRLLTARSGWKDPAVGVERAKAPNLVLRHIREVERRETREEFAAAVVLAGSPDSTYAAFYTNGSGGVLVTVALCLVPFAGIAFLWFRMAFRALAAGAVALMLHFANVPAPPVSVDRVLSSVGCGLVFVYGVRVAGTFTITTTTLARRAGLMPRWLAVLSYLMAAFLLATTTTEPATLLVYPAWVLLLSLAMVRSVRTWPGPASPAEGPKK
jgi:hypothetical protein